MISFFDASQLSRQREAHLGSHASGPKSKLADGTSRASDDLERIVRGWFVSGHFKIGRNSAAARPRYYLVD